VQTQTQKKTQAQTQTHTHKTHSSTNTFLRTHLLEENSGGLHVYKHANAHIHITP